jgi:hypothetical protein
MALRHSADYHVSASSFQRIGHDAHAFVVESMT